MGDHCCLQILSTTYSDARNCMACTGGGECISICNQVPIGALLLQMSTKLYLMTKNCNTVKIAITCYHNKIRVCFDMLIYFFDLGPSVLTSKVSLEIVC
jgi:hypothetical protein